MSIPRYQIQHGPCGDGIERIDDSSSGPVECPGCGADVPWETIRDGRCEECRHDTETLEEHIKTCAQCAGPDDGCEEGQRLEELTLSAAPEKKLARENERLRKALRDLMPFVLEDYYPECATPAFKAAVEAAKVITGQ